MCSDDVSKTDSTLSNPVSDSSATSSGASSESAAPTTSGICLGSVEHALLLATGSGAETRARTKTSSAVCDSLDGHSNARRAPDPGPLHDVASATQDRARGGARHEQEPREEQRAADDRRAGLPDERSERAADGHADPATGVLAEERHEAEEAHPHAQPERANVQKVAAREQEPAERDERDRQHVGGVADDLRRATSASQEPTAPPSSPR